MDYEWVDHFLRESGLDKDPAFDYLHFLDEPIPQGQANRITLGLYYPKSERDGYGYVPPSTIHLPPDASISTLLHELGHRHGHYYYGDLSEQYAENYRKSYEQGLQIPTRLEICTACVEMGTGRSRICMCCEYGGAPVASVQAVASAFTNIVHFEDPPGTRLTTTQFNPGQALHIAIEARVAGIPQVNAGTELYIHTTGQIEFPPIFQSGQTNLLGNIAFDIVLPNVVTTADCVVTVYDALAGAQITTIPIGIGTTPLPPPPPPKSIVEQLGDIAKALAIGAGAIGLIYLASKAVPSVAEATRSLKKTY